MKKYRVNFFKKNFTGGLSSLTEDSKLFDTYEDAAEYAHRKARGRDFNIIEVKMKKGAGNEETTE